MEKALSGILVVIVLFLVQTTSAAVQIHQVLYDPLQESGSEAVELFNNGNETVEISGWQLESDQFSPDAVLPNNSLIEPNGFFLIADKNWSKQKDNNEWPNADYEEAITLRNSNGSVGLKNTQGTLVDSVRWGSNTKFSQAIDAPQVKEGESIILKEDNVFVVATPVFGGQKSSIILLEVELPKVSILNISILSDDSLMPGVQIIPYSGRTREIIVRVVVQKHVPVIDFLNTTSVMNLLDNNTYETRLKLPFTTSPGNLTVVITAGNSTQSFNIEIFSNKAWRVEPRKIVRSALQGETISQEFTLLNEGNVAVQLVVDEFKLLNSNTTIKGKLETDRIRLIPGQQAIVHASISVPFDVVGIFSGTISLYEEEN